MDFFTNKKFLFAAAGVLVVVLFWVAFGNDTEESTAIYAKPQTGKFNVTIMTNGELRAKNSTNVMAPSGMRQFRIYRVKIQRLVPEGTVVDSGDFVAELDRSDLSNSLKDSKQDLKERRTSYEDAKLDTAITLTAARNNIKDLKFSLDEAQIAVEQSKYESPAQQRQVKNDLDKAQRALKQGKKKYINQKRQAKAKMRHIQENINEDEQELEHIQQAMKDFTIQAPEQGMVIYKRGRDGSKLTEGDQINVFDPVVAKLPDFSVMNSVTYVNEVDIQKVNIGQPVNIGLDAMPDKQLTGTVTNVANIGQQRPNSDSKVFKVTIQVNESDTTLRPSMTTSNSIQVASKDSTMYVPLETIHTTDSLDFVYKRDGVNPLKQQVVLGLMNDNNVIIKAGVSKEDKLYLSTPKDTSDVQTNYLSKETLKKYRQNLKTEENNKKQNRPSKEELRKMRQRKMGPGQHHEGPGGPPGGQGGNH